MRGVGWLSLENIWAKDENREKVVFEDDETKMRC